jgi:hypothetical protein
MYVLVPKGFDLNSIEKCIVDYMCNFVTYQDEDAINSRIDTYFVVLHETYFTVHVGNQQSKFDYDCRNRVMRDAYLNQGHVQPLRLNTIDDAFHNIEPPYLLFANENMRWDSVEDNTIMANYNKVDILKFAEIAKSKACNDKFFVVYLGDDRYICCNTQTLETYEYTSIAKSRIIRMLYEKSDDPFQKLKSEYDQLKAIEPVPRCSNFPLKDIEGHTLEENTDYCLELYDADSDILRFMDNQLSSTHYLNQVKQVIVQYSIVNGIHHLVFENKYLHVADGDDEITLTGQPPDQHHSLEFQMTEENTFFIVRWGQSKFLALEDITYSYGSVNFQDDNCDLEFYLKRV